MYIQNLTENIDDAGYQGMVDPNIVSGADLDDRFMGFSDDDFVGFDSDDFMGYDCANYMDYSGENPELIELHEKIQTAIAEVAEAKPKMAAAKQRLKEVSAQMQQPNLSHDERMKYRAAYSNVSAEISKLSTYINSREKGSIMGMKAQFEQIAGEPYVYEAPEPEITNTVLDGVNPMATGKKDIISKVADATGLSRQNTIFALGGAAVLGIVLLTRK